MFPLFPPHKRVLSDASLEWFMRDYGVASMPLQLTAGILGGTRGGRTSARRGRELGGETAGEEQTRSRKTIAMVYQGLSLFPKEGVRWRVGSFERG